VYSLVIHTSSSRAWRRNKGSRGSGANDSSQFVRQCLRWSGDGVEEYVHIERKGKRETAGGHNEWISSGHVRPAGWEAGRGLGSGFVWTHCPRSLFMLLVGGSQFRPERWSAAEWGWLLDRRKEAIYRAWFLNTAALLWPDEQKKKIKNDEAWVAVTCVCLCIYMCVLEKDSTCVWQNTESVDCPLYDLMWPCLKQQHIYSEVTVV